MGRADANWEAEVRFLSECETPSRGVKRDVTDR